jgi:hypothetical protein
MNKRGWSPAPQAPALYWSPRIEGDRAGVGIWLPGERDPGEVEISVPVLSHIVAADPIQIRVAPQSGASATCNVDVPCAWKNSANAVAHMPFTTNADTVTLL